jgi:hypothetical protein
MDPIMFFSVSNKFDTNVDKFDKQLLRKKFFELEK